jgi:hypothetical protein
MCRVMADKCLDRLLFGKGEGTNLRQVIVREALCNFEEEKRRAERRGLGLISPYRLSFGHMLTNMPSQKATE